MHLPDLSSEAQSPLFQLSLGTGAAVPYWAESRFEHELPQLLMGSWGLPAPKIPSFWSHAIFCHSHPKNETP